MTRIRDIFRPHAWAALVGPALMALEVACDLGQPWCLSRIVDDGIRHGDATIALRYAALMFGIALLGAVGGIGCTVFAARASTGFGADLREAVYSGALRLTLSDQGRLPPSTLLNRLSNDVAQIQGIVLICLRILVRAPLLTLGGIAMILVLDPILGSRFLWPLPLLGLLLVFVIGKSFPLFARVQTKLDALGTVVRENLSGVRVVKAFVRHREEIRRFGKANTELAESGISAQRIVGGTLPLVQLLLNLSMVGLVWFGGAGVAAGELPLGKFMAMVNYLTQILFSLMMSAMMLMTVVRGKSSLVRVRELLAAGDRGEDVFADGPAPSVGSETSGAGASLRFHSVTFRHPEAGADSLTDVSLALEAGETLGVLGPTGAGKSTLVSLVLRFSDPSSGEILADEMNLRERDAAAWRHRVGWVSQAPVLFTGTVRENLLWGNPEASDDDLRDAMDLAQARDFVEALPEGWETIVGQRGVNLSGGQKQRLAIARALVRKPALLILDDATSALDGRTEARLRQALDASLPDATRIVVAQKISSVALADRIILLDQGRVAGLGTHPELLVSNALYRDIWRSQVGSSEVPA